MLYWNIFVCHGHHRNYRTDGQTAELEAPIFMQGLGISPVNVTETTTSELEVGGGRCGVWGDSRYSYHGEDCGCVTAKAYDLTAFETKCHDRGGCGYITSASLHFHSKGHGPWPLWMQLQRIELFSISQRSGV